MRSHPRPTVLRELPSTGDYRQRTLGPLVDEAIRTAAEDVVELRASSILAFSSERT